ncbi:M48 family metalloprotease [Flavobacterium sp.]|uniref:M48 family metalloprotease n=1 Tax=Flavobacterium sp. TaxID=239 RepID=UPI0026299ADE|nr:M48 family metalloprotease [Flavobacterium sp.]
MEIKTKTFLKKGLTLFFSVMSFFMFGQNKEEPQIRKVFNQIVLAYGSSKTAPELVVTKQKQDRPAFYKFDKKPIVTIDAYLFTICRSFGKDSLNALSVVIGHELAHYYNEHSFCTDFAFAIRNKNEVFSKKVKLIDKNQKIIYETQADDKGLFYAAIAGYEPFEVQPKLLDTIYTQYLLKDADGYPTKVQRKEIAKNALLKAKRLYETFTLGLKYIQEKNYDKAIEAFNTVNNDFPSRENYNNLGVAKTRKALDLQEPNTIEKASPERFLYPIEIENKSRLNKEITRSLDDNSEVIEQLLKDAQNDFQEAIRLDPNFTKGYINLACVLDLLGNYPKSIGTIFDLTKEQQNSIEAKRILAIAYFHDKQENKALAIWNELKL